MLHLTCKRFIMSTCAFAFVALFIACQTCAAASSDGYAFYKPYVSTAQTSYQPQDHHYALAEKTRLPTPIYIQNANRPHEKPLLRPYETHKNKDGNVVERHKASLDILLGEKEPVEAEKIFQKPQRVKTQYEILQEKLAKEQLKTQLNYELKNPFEGALPQSEHVSKLKNPYEHVHGEVVQAVPLEGEAGYEDSGVWSGPRNSRGLLTPFLDLIMNKSPADSLRRIAGS